jgi:hypothetical protein
MSFLDFNPYSQASKLTILPHKLFLVKISKSDELFERKIKQIVKLIFFPDSNTPFFSYNETEGDISFIVDSDTVQNLGGNDDNLVVSKQHYKAIQIFEGADAINQPGLVRRFTQPIAQVGISIIYYSTYYTDLMLVEEERLEQAYAILQKNLPTILSPQQEHRLSSEPLKSKSNNVIKSMELSPLSQRLILACFARESIPHLTHALLKLLLFPDRDDRFLSITITSEEVSLVMEEKSFSSLPTEFCSRVERNANSWKAIQISAGPMGFSGNTLGAVTQVSDILALNGISIFYLSTFDDDFILVQNDKTEAALKLLQGSAEN